MNKHLQKVSEIILDNLSNESQKFSGKSVLLTGAGGFLGSNICSFFIYLNSLDILDKPVELFAYDKFIHKKEDWVNQYNKSTLINFYEEDILSIKEFSKMRLHNTCSFYCFTNIL